MKPVLQTLILTIIKRKEMVLPFFPFFLSSHYRRAGQCWKSDVEMVKEGENAFYKLTAVNIYLYNTIN